MTKDLINRITYHLSSGGLFNPELADHLTVRSLLMECREALAQPEQEPVAWAMYQKGRLLSFWMDKGDAYNFEFTSEHSWSPLYTTPPQRKPLTDEEAQQIFAKHNCTISTHLAGILARAIEAKLKENT